jgi:RIO-like serine/threonine protein kinase
MKFESTILRPDKDSGKFEKAENQQERFHSHLEEIMNQPEHFLGKGAAAQVRQLTFGRKDICVKIHEEIDVMARDIENVPEGYKKAYTEKTEEEGPPWRQTVREEAETANAARVLSRHAKVPEVYRIVRDVGSEIHDGCWIEQKREMLIMEQIIGFDLEQVIMKGQLLPAGFDVDMFCDNLEKFISEINARGVYHRDLAPRNVMVNLDNINEPVVIDFGRSTQFGASDPYEEHISKDGQLHKMTFTSPDDDLARKYRNILKNCEIAKKEEILTK